jgi:carbon monoxide dehydrogenase subunit G
MPQAEASIHIDAPPEAVFDFVADAPRVRRVRS